MVTYVVVDIEWHDQAKAAEYRELFGPAIAKYGGRTLCAGPPQVIEGSWNPSRVVVLEFPTTAAFHSWYGSPEYAPALKLRMEGASTKAFVLVEGPTH